MKDPTPSPERRTHRRRPLSVPMTIVSQGARTPVSAVNVSIGGAAVHSASVASVGDVVSLELAPSRRPVVALSAKVVRAEHGVLGLRFLALGQRALEALLETSGVSGERSAEQGDAAVPAPQEP